MRLNGCCNRKNDILTDELIENYPVGEGYQGVFRKRVIVEPLKEGALPNYPEYLYYDKESGTVVSQYSKGILPEYDENGNYINNIALNEVEKAVKDKNWIKVDEFIQQEKKRLQMSEAEARDMRLQTVMACDEGQKLIDEAIGIKHKKYF